MSVRGILLLDVALLAACLLHLPALLHRPELPVRTTGNGGVVVVRDAGTDSGLRAGDRILRCDGREVFRREVLELCADLRSIGDAVTIEALRNGEPVSASVRLTAAYTPGVILAYVLIGLLSWLVAVYVLLRGPRGTTASVLHWGLISLAVVVMTAWEGVTRHGILPPPVPGILFFSSYLGVAVCFLHFTLLFPRRHRGADLPWILGPYAGSAIVVVLILLHQTNLLRSGGAEGVRAFWAWFDVFHVLIMVWILCAIAAFVLSWKRTETVADRRKLQWILYGLTIGPTPFVFLTLVPDLLSGGPAVPEEYTLPFLVVIPAALAISVIRYRVLDIRFVIRRTTSYVVVLGFIVLAYIGLLALLADAIGARTRGASIAAAVLTALAFEPVRRRVQLAVDRRFFRVDYDFRAAQRRLSEDLKRCGDTGAVAALLVRETDALMPVERIGFFEMRRPSSLLHVLAHKGFDRLERHAVRFHPDELKTRLERPVAVSAALEPGVDHEPADEGVFARWGIALVFPLLRQDLEILGFLALGPRKSGRPFSSEDADLLRAITTQAALELERIRLQVAVVEEHSRAERERQLGALKSDFVSFVSHDLKTPLASIRMFAELLRSRNREKPDRKGLEYIRIIEGEADRLARMVTNVLDLTKMESGEGGYRQVPVDLRVPVREAVAAMTYEIRKHGVRPELRLGRSPLMVHADPAAVGQAVSNLIGNALKYAAEGKYLAVELSLTGNRVVCSVADRGPGIRPEALPHLFERFYRDTETSAKRQGIGLGLPLVRHIMTAHGGEVTVRSTPGDGATFTLSFPLIGNPHAVPAPHPYR